jgi:hypothetical protein
VHRIIRSRARTVERVALRWSRRRDARPRRLQLAEYPGAPEGGRWTVAAILDWEFAFAGSILVDIGNMLRYERPGQSRYEPHFSRGLADAGVDLPDDWFFRARLADLPALCELLTREDVPDAVADELRDLIGETASSF